MQRSVEEGFSIGLRVLICGAFSLWLALTALRDLVGHHPILINFTLMVMGAAMAGLGVLNFRSGKGKQHLGVSAVAVALVLLSGRLFLNSM